MRNRTVKMLQLILRKEELLNENFVFKKLPVKIKSVQQVQLKLESVSNLVILTVKVEK